jgi:hypothetical protein
VKSSRTLLIVMVGAVAFYLLYRYMKSKDTSNSGTGVLGSNLNSVAPDLVGGSTGPELGPAVSLPINITLNDTSSMSSQNEPPYQSANPALPQMNGMSTGSGSIAGPIEYGTTSGTPTASDSGTTDVSAPDDTNAMQPVMATSTNPVQASSKAAATPAAKAPAPAAHKPAARKPARKPARRKPAPRRAPVRRAA